MTNIMQLAEQAGLLGPTSRVGDSHAATERFAALHRAAIIEELTGELPEPLMLMLPNQPETGVYSADQLRQAIAADRAKQAGQSEVPQELSDKAQELAAEFRGDVARKDYESWGADVLKLLDWMTFINTKPQPSPAQPVNADLIAAAERVSLKYGHSEDGTPSDWTEWKDLRNALAQSAPLPQPQGERGELIAKLRGYASDDDYVRKDSSNGTTAREETMRNAAALLEAKLVPLTDERIDDIENHVYCKTIEKGKTRHVYLQKFARAIEAAHGIEAQGKQDRKGNV